MPLFGREMQKKQAQTKPFEVENGPFFAEKSEKRDQKSSFSSSKEPFSSLFARLDKGFAR